MRLLASLSMVLALGPMAPALAQTPPAENEPAVMIVLDGSGSMWGKIGKDQKINAVRDVLKQVLPQVLATAPPISLGLTAFGHRRTGDCSDVDVSVPSAKGTIERVMTALDKLNPKGKGPLGHAVKAAAESLNERSPKDVRRSLIVVADNADNCKVDTCELAQELRQSQPRLTIHVIALGVSKDETVPLACLATTSGGRLFKADSATEIATAFEQSFKLAAGPVGPPTPTLPAATTAQPAAAPQAPKPAPVPAGPPGLHLTALLAPGGAEIIAGIRWRIMANESAAKSGARPALYEGEERNPNLDLAPGSYRVEATFGLATVEQAVTVGAVGRTQVQVPLNAGIINVKDSGARNGPSSDRVFYTLYAAASSPKDKPRAIALSSDTAPVYNVASGTYVIAVQQGLARIERSVTVAPGTVTDLDIPLYLGELRLSAVVNEGGPPLDRMLFLVFEDDPDAAGGLRELVRSSASQPEFSLPAGSYLVVARHDGAEARERVSVKPGTRLTKGLVLASGRLTLSARLPAKAQGRLDAELLSYRIERVGMPRPATATKSGDPGSDEVSRAHAPEHVLALTAGKYRVESRYGAINARSQREIEIKAGTPQTIALELDAGLVTLKLGSPRPAATKPPEKPAGGQGAVASTTGATLDVYWEIADASGRTIWSTTQTSPRLPLAAGRYLARAETRTAKAEQLFQVSGGDDKTVEVELK